MTGSLAFLCLSVITFAVGQDYRTWTGPGVFPPDDTPKQSDFQDNEIMPKSKISSLFDDSRSRQESGLMEHPPFRGPRRPGRPKSDELPDISTILDTVSRAIQLWWDMGKKAMNLLAMTNQKDQRYRKVRADSLPHWPGMLWQNDDEDSQKNEPKPYIENDDLEAEEDVNLQRFKSKKKKYFKPLPADSEQQLDVIEPESELL